MSRCHLLRSIAAIILMLIMASCESLPEQIMDNRGFNMNLVPAGDFERTILEETDLERIVRVENLGDFYIDTHEVTNQQYDECAEAGECAEPVNTIPYSDSTRMDHPVVFITWEMAESFCKWRGARLPTRAEWEKAAGDELNAIDFYWGYETPVCQAGTPQGAEIDPRSTYDPETYPAGSSSPNVYGLYDMTGNMWEWVQDNYELESDTQSPDIVSFMRMFRWHGYGPLYQRYVCSFRCAKSP